MAKHIKLDDLLRAGKRRWGNEHLVVAESYDGIMALVWLFAERGQGDDRELVPLLTKASREELLKAIESVETGP